MLILDNFLCELNSHIIIWPFRLNITFVWLQKLNPGYEICIISYQVNLSNEVSAMFNSLMPSLNSRSLPFVVFLGGFPSRCQNLSSGAIRPGGLLYMNTDQSSHINYAFIPLSKPNHRTPFTTALRDVKEAFRRGQGSTDCPRSDRGSPWSRVPLDTKHNKLGSR